MSDDDESEKDLSEDAVDELLDDPTDDEDAELEEVDDVDEFGVSKKDEERSWE